MQVLIKVPKLATDMKFHVYLNDKKLKESILNGTSNTTIQANVGDKIKFQQGDGFFSHEIIVKKDTKHVTLKRNKIFFVTMGMIGIIIVLIIFLFFFPMHNGVNMFDRMFPVLILTGVLAGYPGLSLGKMYVIEQE